MVMHIDVEMISTAFFFVAVLLAVASVPHMAYTTIRGEIVVRRHVAARDLDPDSELTPTQRRYVSIRKDNILFHKAVGEELERLGSMRNSVPLAIVSAVILLAMMFWPGFTDEALPFAVAMLVVLVLCCVLGFMVTGTAVRRYLALLDECAQENHHPENMYG